MPWAGGTIKDYSVVVSRSEQRPEAELYSFSIQDEIPTVVIPLKLKESVTLALQAVFLELMGRAHYDARINYAQPLPPPTLSPEVQAKKRDSAQQSPSETLN